MVSKDMLMPLPGADVGNGQTNFHEREPGFGTSLVERRSSGRSKNAEELN